MVYVFPRITKCTFHKFGSSGTISRHDSMCVLSQNIINEKTYIFLWFWFIIMATLLSLLVVYRYVKLFFELWNVYSVTNYPIFLEPSC